MQSLKCVVVGDSGTGKTSLLSTAASKVFPETVEMVCDNVTVTVTVQGKPIGVSLWDTAAAEEYDRLRVLVYPQTDVCICLFSVVDPVSFGRVKEKWYPEVQHYCSYSPVLLVGNKVDLREDVRTIEKLDSMGQSPISHEQGELLAQELSACYMECSVLTQSGLDEVLKEVVYRAIPIARPRPKKGGGGGCLLI
uniref:Uncharacterized protein n=1 Tax=Arcella intermedia TaxID=1963864 RepID=A0A6B2LJU2_9EUKA